MKLIDPNSILAVLGTIALILIGITSPEFFSPGLKAFLFQPVTAQLSLLLGLSVIFILVVIYATYMLMTRTRNIALEREQKLLVKDQEIKVLQRQLRDSDRLSLLDVVTGIPNQRKW